MTVALDLHAAGVAVDLHHREVDAVGVDLMLDPEPAFGRQAGLAAAERLRGRRQMIGDLAEAHRRPRGPILAHHLAVDDVERVGRRLHQLGRHLDRFRPQLDGAVVGGGCRHHGRARGMRADAVGDAVGLAVGHAHAPVVDAQNLGADLRHHGLEALAERGAAGDELDRARAIDLDPHAVGRPEPALLDEHRKAGTDRLAGGAAARQSRP